MIAVFHVLGKIPSLRDLLKSLVIGSEISTAANFSNFVGISSGPVDLFGSREFIRESTSRSLTCIVSSAGTDRA